MKYINRLRIRSRLLLATIIPVLLSAVTIAWIAADRIHENGQVEVQRLEENLLEARKQALKDVVQTIHTVVRDVVQDPALTEAQAQAEARKRLRAASFGQNNYVFAYDRAITNLAYRPNPAAEGPSTNPVLIKLVKNLFKAAESNTFYDYVWLNPASGADEPKVSYAVLIPEWDWMIGTGVYVTDIERILATERAAVDEQVATTLNYILLGTGAVILATLVLATLVGRTITMPLNRVSSLMQEIALGEGDLRRRLPAEGRDEFADLGRHFNAFVIKIQETIQKVGSTTDHVAGSAEKLSLVARDTRQSVQAQGSETDQIASAINEMAATVHQIAGNANAVQNAASDANRLAREGGEVVSHAQKSVNALSQEISESADTIDALAKKSDDIQQILDVIQAVTDQTNLLALNAAIEAARAGEHGRGFSVVADEVRQLAHRSSESASQIGHLINGFVSDTRASVDRMRSSRTRSEETVERIDHAAGVLRTIEASIGTILEQITQVAAGSEQQSQVAEEVNQSVVRIVNSARQSSDGMNQTSEASRELARLGESLRDLVSQFKV